MRTLIILLMVVIIGLSSSGQGISGNITAYHGGKAYRGWIDDKGNVAIMNNNGKTIMAGHVNKTGGIEINDNKNDDMYQGRMSGFGNCILHSGKGGPPLRIESEYESETPKGLKVR